MISGAAHFQFFLVSIVECVKYASNLVWETGFDEEKR